MRQDIEIHINTGDIVLTPINNSVFRAFRWVDETDGLESRYIYGEITIPAMISENSILTNGIYTQIPYTPVYKECKFRFKRDLNTVEDSYVINPTDGSEWFTVKTSLYGNEADNVYVSELWRICEGDYFIKITDGEAMIYEGNNLDFNIIKANTQNKNLLLACNPGNNYRYPLSGVGIQRWINSNLSSNQLAQIIQSEFSSDGTPVRSALYYPDLHYFDIILDTTNVD